MRLTDTGFTHLILVIGKHAGPPLPHLRVGKIWVTCIPFYKKIEYIYITVLNNSSLWVTESVEKQANLILR